MTKFLSLFVGLFTVAASASPSFQGTLDLKKIGIGKGIYRLEVTTDIQQTAHGETQKSVFGQHLPGDDQTQYFCETTASFAIGTAHVQLINAKTGQLVQRYDAPISGAVDAQYEVASEQAACDFYWKDAFSENTVFSFAFHPVPVGSAAKSLTVEFYLYPAITMTGHRTGDTYDLDRVDSVAGEVSIVTHWGTPTHTKIIPLKVN